MGAALCADVMRVKEGSFACMTPLLEYGIRAKGVMRGTPRSDALSGPPSIQGGGPDEGLTLAQAQCRFVTEFAGNAISVIRPPRRT